MFQRPTVHLADVPALIASLPDQFGDPIPARALVLLLTKATGQGYSIVENVTISPVEQLDTNAIIELTSGMVATTAVAVVIDDTATYVGANGYEHALLIDAAAFHLRDRGTQLEATYAARALTGHPVWSIETDQPYGIVPAAEQAHPLAVYTLADAITTRPANPLPRLAD
ncbi:hypothetical protein [Nocardia yamanashiensis]|uniref:hypothetical protein n=1 Tax=Nocardia yamanashiensis TaxID=209247 RepID=UPI00082D60C9|nr:hypothetical protein [Nocardia yamanashiensis]